MICATCFSWLAISVLGNAVASVDPEASASANTRPCCKALLVAALADGIRERPVSKVSRFCRAAKRALELPEPLKPASTCPAPPLEASGLVAIPWQKTDCPAKEMIMGKLLPASDCTLSAVRPAQPVWALASKVAV